MNIAGSIFALTASLLQAVSYIYLKLGMREFKPSLAYLFDAIFGVIIWTPLALLLGANLTTASNLLPFTLISAFIAEALVFYVLKHGKLAITGLLVNTYPVFTIIFSRFINHETLTSSQLSAVILITVSLIISAVPEKKSPIKWMYTILPILTALGIGLSDSLSKLSLHNATALDFLLSLGFAQLPASLVFSAIEKQPLSEIITVIKSPARYRYPLTGSLLIVISMTFFWLAFKLIPASIASPLSGTSPIIIALLSPWFLKESLNRKDYLVLLLGIIGIITLNLS